MVEKGIRGGIYHSFFPYVESNNKYMKNYDKHNPLWYIQYWYVNDLYGWSMSQKLPINNFQRIKDTSQFNEDFIKSYNEEISWSWFSIS